MLRFPVLELACLLVLLLMGEVLSICPRTCLCTRSHREVDCSGRNLSELPNGLQHNIHTLNLSYNSLVELHYLLSRFAHLRTLDISYNLLTDFPASLPRALWEIYASGNGMRLLDKNDTAYHWNLKTLDLSGNELERVVFINNTLPNLRSLNLSSNKFWTVPTNMPAKLQTVDLSNNYLVQILPATLDRLPDLAYFYLHNNRFSSVSDRAFSKLTGLKLITLNDNPWVCEEEQNISYLLSWVKQTPARVVGCPCFTRHVCGRAQGDKPQPRLTTNGGWHFASYTQSSATGSSGRVYGRPMPAVTESYASNSAAVLLKPPSNRTSSHGSAVHPPVFKSRFPLTSSSVTTPDLPRSTTPSSTTSATRKTASVIRSTSTSSTANALRAVAVNLLLPTLAMMTVT
ncbi:OMGP protein, partial [Polyodon spathula]|nr:OMGP protein [Polyodon spathula]